MELNDANLQTLTEFLRKTLDPDPNVRRPGNPAHWQNIDFKTDCIEYLLVFIDLCMLSLLIT